MQPSLAASVQRAGLRAPAHATAVALTRRRVYILPTRYGLGFAAVILAMLLGSANYSNSLGYVLTFLLGSLGLVSLLHTYRNLAGLVVRAGKVKPVFAGGTAHFGLSLDNRDGPARHAIVLSRSEARASAPPVLEDPVPADILHHVELPVPTHRRGWLHLGRVTVSSCFPLGLFRAWSHVALDEACLVYPAPAGERRLPDAASDPVPRGGAHGTGREDFSGFRDYFPGDSPRQIHWKAVARGQGVPVKLFAGAGTTHLHIRWSDTSGPAVETRLAQLCRWVLGAESGGYRYSLELPGQAIPAGNGDRHLHECLKALALFGDGDG